MTVNVTVLLATKEKRTAKDLSSTREAFETAASMIGDAQFKRVTISSPTED